MRGSCERVYALREFPASELAEAETVALMVNYDDAFIAYLNGEEVLRVGVGEGTGPAATDIARHEARRYEYVELDVWRQAIEDDDLDASANDWNEHGASSIDVTHIP